MRVTHNSLKTDKPVVLEFPIELEFRNVDYLSMFSDSTPLVVFTVTPEGLQGSIPQWDQALRSWTPR